MKNTEENFPSWQELKADLIILLKSMNPKERNILVGVTAWFILQVFFLLTGEKVNRHWNISDQFWPVETLDLSHYGPSELFCWGFLPIIAFGAYYRLNRL